MKEDLNMINAREARQNVINKEMNDYRTAETRVIEFLDEMSDNIQFYSQNGITEIAFAPYIDSRFPDANLKELAKKIFDRILKQNGYTIMANSIEINILKVQW